MVSEHTMPVVLDQALHGYADGHRLLASSRKLSKESLRTMLVLSDMSGPSMVNGFEEYLTGYPLPEDGLFALARTWYAPEMKRAGCVWTHTLLMSHSSLEPLEDPAYVLPLFQNPSGRDSLADFNNPLELPPNRGVRSVLGELQVSLALPLLQALYQTADPVVIVADTSREYEDLLLAIWAQQWPLSPGRFRFCTGSIRSRELEGHPFDLQIIPPTALRDTQRRLPASTIIESSAPTPHSDSDNWISLAIRDLCADKQRALRDFLWSLAGDGGESRVGFGSYVNAFSTLNSVRSGGADINELIAVVAESFPSSSQAQRLKMGLFGDPSERKEFLDREESVLLQALVTTDNPSAFDPASLCVSQRIGAAWQQSDNWVVTQMLPLFHQPLNPLQEMAVTSILDFLQQDQLCPILRRFPDTFLPIVARRSSTLTTPALWQCPPEIQSSLIDALQAADLSPEGGEAIIAAQLAVGNDVSADKMAAWLGVHAIHAVLNWLASSSNADSHSIPAKWQQILGEQPEAIIEWLTDRPDLPIAAVTSIVRILDPRCRVVRDSSIDLWLRLSERSQRELPGGEATDAMAFFLVVALSRDHESSSVLVARSFPTVYSAAATDALGNRALMILQSELSGISWQWDKCRRLRRGLVETFAEQSWPSSSFLECTRDTTLLAAIYEMWGWDHTETHFLREVVRDASAGDAGATEAQLGILVRFKKWCR